MGRYLQNWYRVGTQIGILLIAIPIGIIGALKDGVKGTHDFNVTYKPNKDETYEL